MPPLRVLIDAPALARHAIYHDQALRHAYLKLRWKRSRTARRLLDPLFRHSFGHRAREAQARILELFR